MICLNACDFVENSHKIKIEGEQRDAKDKIGSKDWNS